MVNYRQPDLGAHPPRSPRCRLGGYVHLPRLLDKARAHVAGKLGDYIWKSGLDQRFAQFAGVDLDALHAEVAAGRSDSELLAWVTANARPAREAWEIEAWSRWMLELAPGDAKRHAMFVEILNAHAPNRDDIRTLVDRLELDDYVSFGGGA